MYVVSHMYCIIFTASSLKVRRNQIEEWSNLVAVDASVAATEKSSNNVIQANWLQKYF